MQAPSSSAAWAYLKPYGRAVSWSIQIGCGHWLPSLGGSAAWQCWCVCCQHAFLVCRVEDVMLSFQGWLFDSERLSNFVKTEA